MGTQYPIMSTLPCLQVSNSPIADTTFPGYFPLPALDASVALATPVLGQRTVVTL